MDAKCSFARSPLNWDEPTSAGTTEGNAIESPSAPSKMATVKQITKSANSRRSSFTNCMISSSSIVCFARQSSRATQQITNFRNYKWQVHVERTRTLVYGKFKIYTPGYGTVFENEGRNTGFAISIPPSHARMQSNNNNQ